MSCVLTLARRALCAALLFAVGAVAIGYLAPSTRRLVSLVTEPAVRRSARLEETLVDLAMTAAATAVVVLGVSGMGVAVAAGRSNANTFVRLGCALAPRWWRPIVIAACGVGLAAPGVALGGRDEGHEGCPTRCKSPVVGLSLPDLPSAHDPRIRDVDRTIVVVPGDSLWAIAAGGLAPASSNAEIADVVAALYRTNRHVIGDDPDLIFPGTHLTVPGGTHDPHHLDPQPHRSD